MTKKKPFLFWLTLSSWYLAFLLPITFILGSVFHLFHIFNPDYKFADRIWSALVILFVFSAIVSFIFSIIQLVRKIIKKESINFLLIISGVLPLLFYLFLNGFSYDKMAFFIKDCFYFVFSWR